LGGTDQQNPGNKKNQINKKNPKKEPRSNSEGFHKQGEGEKETSKKRSGEGRKQREN